MTRIRARSGDLTRRFALAALVLRPQAEAQIGADTDIKICLCHVQRFLQIKPGDCGRLRTSGTEAYTEDGVHRLTA